MKRNTQKMFQELVSYIDFPTVVYINETGRIIASNYNARLIIGDTCKNIKELIDNDLKKRFHRVIIEQLSQVFTNIMITSSEKKIEVDLELNVIRYGSQHIIFCFFQQSYKLMYEKYLSLLVPRLFYKDMDLRFVYGSRYFLQDSKIDLSRNVHNEDIMDEEVGQYITKLEQNVLVERCGEYNSIHTIKSRSQKEYFARMNRIPLLDSDGEAIGLIGVYSIILKQAKYKGLFNAVLRQNQIMNRIFSQQGKYVVSWRLSEGWPIEHISSNFSDFGYVLLDVYGGAITWRSIIHSGDYERIKKELEDSLKSDSKELPMLKYRIRKASGRYVWVEDQTYLLENDGETYLREGMFWLIPKECYEDLEKEYERCQE